MSAGFLGNHAMLSYFAILVIVGVVLVGSLLLVMMFGGKRSE
jgi:hypothetical protein